MIHMYLNSSYDSPIVNNIRITDDEQTILTKLGEGAAKFISVNKILVVEDDNIYILIDIKNHKGYVYFKRELKDIEKFTEYVDKYLKDRDIKSFVNNMTTTYKEYDKFLYNSRKVDLRYPSYGIRIYASNDYKTNNGIKIYSNSKYYSVLKEKYFGKDSNKNNNYEVLRDAIELGVIFENEDLVEHELREKIDSDNAIGESYVNDFENPFNVAVTLQESEDNDSQRYNGCVVCFADPKIERYNLNTAATADSIVVTSKYIYYSLNNLGIFRLEPYTRTLSKLVDNKGNIEVVSVENGIMAYNENGQKHYMNNMY